MEYQRLKQYIIHKLNQKGIKPHLIEDGFTWHNTNLL